MSIIYVVSNYGRLVKKGDVLQLRKGDDLLKTIFPFKTEQLVIVGRIEITSAAINLLMRHQIDTVFCIVMAGLTEKAEAESDYERPEKRGVLLTKEGLRKVITQFEKKLDTPFFYPPVDGRITHKKIFFEQIKHFRRVLTGEESRYNPFQIK